MPNLKDRLRRIPLPLLLALVVAVGASVIMVVQITVLPAPPSNSGPSKYSGFRTD
jgi:hypothetical protein